MEKVIPDLYRKYIPSEYEKEFERIKKRIDNIIDIDFEIIINTDIPFRIDYLKIWKRPFSDLTEKPISTQKQVYIRWLENIFMFHYPMFQAN